VRAAVDAMAESIPLPTSSTFHDPNTSTNANRQYSLSAQSVSYRPSTSRWARRHPSDASIALVGIRGTGLSTLAVIAASFLNFKLLDADHQFHQITGLSRASYKSNHGIAQYREAETALLRSMLLENASRTVIVCGPGAVEPSGQFLLSQFASDHPVIYVTRDSQGIQDHLRVADAATVAAVQKASAPVLRSVSNFEYHNSTHVTNQQIEHASAPRTHGPLALKQVEKDFVQFLRSVTGHGDSSQQGQHAARPMLFEGRRVTYDQVVPLPVSDGYWTDLASEDVLADAVEVLIPLRTIGSERGGFDGLAADYITRQYCAAKSSTHLPVVLGFRSVRQRSGFAVECYQEALYHCLRLAPDLLCVDLTLDQNLIRHLAAVKGKTRIIAEYARPGVYEDWNSPAWSERVALAQSVGADAVRLSQEATTMADNFAVRHFVDHMNAPNERKITVIAYNTGQLGRMSQYCGTHMNPVADSRLQGHFAPGSYASLLTIRQSHSALYTSCILDALYFGIYGNSVAQSLSPAMHNAAFELSGMPHEYKTFQHSTLRELEYLLSDPNMGGLSITAPFKSQVLSFVDEISHEASMIGAINTLVPLRLRGSIDAPDNFRAGAARSFYGDNTDWIGITNCIMNNLSPINAIRGTTTALVVGAGGMARAATYALVRLGVRRIFIHNRTLERAGALAEHFAERGLLRITEPTKGPVFEQGADYLARFPSISILPEKTNCWPEGVNTPTIIVSCIATRDLNGQCSVDTSLPPLWLTSPTGGVVLEVRRSDAVLVYLTLTDTVVAVLQPSRDATAEANAHPRRSGMDRSRWTASAARTGQDSVRAIHLAQGSDQAHAQGSFWCIQAEIPHHARSRSAISDFSNLKIGTAHEQRLSVRCCSPHCLSQTSIHSKHPMIRRLKDVLGARPD
jgi:3-dehydroquinate dehydratase type I